MERTTLTPEEVWLFRHNGYLKLPARLPEGLVETLKEAIWRDICAEEAPVARDRSGRVVRISQVWARGGVFREALAHSGLLDSLTALLGPNIELVTNRHNHATLRLRGDGTDYLHRDIVQWSRGLVSVIFYLEEATVENGCTWIVPGTQMLPYREALSLTDDDWVHETGIAAQAVPVPMPAGGVLAIDALTMHMPGVNQTDGTRMSMTAGYHSVDELAGTDHPARVLLRGERVYLGNDRG